MTAQPDVPSRPSSPDAPRGGPYDEAPGQLPADGPDGHPADEGRDGAPYEGEGGGPVAVASARLRAFVVDAELEYEPGGRPGEAVVTLPGEKKLRTVVSVVIRKSTTYLSAFVIRHPDENEGAFYRFLLQRNLRMPVLAYAVDSTGDVYVRGEVPTPALDADILDKVFGVVLQAADTPFNDLLAIGFLTSMKKEWAWRIARGESTYNLEAFRLLLE